ncbi:ABC transporter ATP-binding protein [Paraflavisolibacter sp. H34]|uniref:ABC transporter ATP-binding protein n=1 Tax=Huijunlia imazamoxiresistens TaxID=3127457 RepID=UPI0030190997
MSDIVIKAEEIGKLYRLGQIGTGTISHDLNRWFARIRGKADPFAKVGETNDRTVKGTSDYVWALKDINFSVSQGEVLGIVGRNGAGKSTLLKVLSKVTSPSAGRIKVQGRIASLLEVGTGFHPELTGRENIFLNGAILGMTKSEIRSKFDEIVEFSGVDRYIDTPVKRYSSGMYVRLAFSVAAFLEPEILIVDEVLAVGDSEFQKKCLGRMKDVSNNEGRTVLFVSHNMTAIKSLCDNVMVMRNGTMYFHGTADEGLKKYTELNFTEKTRREFNKKATLHDATLTLNSVHIESENPASDILYIEEEQKIVFRMDMEGTMENVSFNISVCDENGFTIFASLSPVFNLETGAYETECIFPQSLLNDNTYSIIFLVIKDGGKVLMRVDDALSFTLNERERTENYLGKWGGMMRPKLTWKQKKI